MEFRAAGEYRPARMLPYGASQKPPMRGLPFLRLLGALGILASIGLSLWLVALASETLRAINHSHEQHGAAYLYEREMYPAPIGETSEGEFNTRSLEDPRGVASAECLGAAFVLIVPLLILRGRFQLRGLIAWVVLAGLAASIPWRWPGPVEAKASPGMFPARASALGLKPPPEWIAETQADMQWPRVLADGPEAFQARWTTREPLIANVRVTTAKRTFLLGANNAPSSVALDVTFVDCLFEFRASLPREEARALLTAYTQRFFDRCIAYETAHPQTK